MIDQAKNFLKSNVRQYAMIIALVVITILFQILTKGILLKPQNVANLIQQNGYVFILGIGMLLCILTGGNIDLSVGSVVAFIGALAGTFVIQLHMNVFLSIVLILLIGLLIGAWQGFWIAFVRIPAFIVTLAGMLMFRGLTLMILRGLTLAPFPDGYLMLSTGFIPDFIGGGFGSPVHITTIVIGVVVSAIYVISQFIVRNHKKRMGYNTLSFGMFITQLVLVCIAILVFAYSLASYKGIPTVLIIVAALILGYSYYASNAVGGRMIYAVGGNEKAAKLSGIRTDWVLFLVYVNMAVLSTVAGIVFSARLNAASPQAGQSFELDAIASCYIGGASAYGGVGTVPGVIIGALVMGVMNNGMSILGVGSDMQMAIKGLVLLVAVAFDILSKSKSRAS